MTLASLDADKGLVKGGLFDHMPEPSIEFHEADRKPWVKIIRVGEEEKKL